MIDIIATILIGTGFFLFGMEMIESKLKHIAGRRLRMMIGKWTKNPIANWFFGFLSGVITHSGSNASLILTNLVSGRLITPENAFPLLAAANIGTVMIVFLFAFNIKLGIMFLLGTTAILYSLSKNARKTPFVGILLGIGLTLYGFNNLEVGAEHLIEIDTVHHFLESLSHSPLFYMLLLLLGIGLRLITQSTSTVTILAITLTGTGLLTFDEAIFAVIGSPIGAAIAMHFESKSIKGIPKQIPYYQMLFEISGSLLILIVYTTEAITGIPLFRKVLTQLFKDPTEQIAFTLLYMRVLPFILFLVLQKPLARFLARKSPQIVEEKLASPEYLYDQALEDPETALELVSQEQKRLFTRLPNFVENARTEHDTEEIIDYHLLHVTSESLGDEIDRFIQEMFNQNLDKKSSEVLIRLQSIQDITMLLEDSVYHMVDEVHNNIFDEEVIHLKDNIIESLHAVLTICHTSIEKDMKNIVNMTSDKGDLLETIRERYLSKLTDGSYLSKKSIIYITDLYGRIIWLLNKWAKLQYSAKNKED